MEYIYVGKFWGTHGLKGEIKFNSSFEYLDKILIKNFKFYIGEDKNKEILINFRFHKGNYLVLFKDLCDIDLVKKYVNKKVYVSRDDLSLDDGEKVFEDYLGLKCYFLDKEFGEVSDIVCYGSNNYTFVINGRKEILIPFNEHFIDKVTDDRIYFKDVEGLIDED